MSGYCLCRALRSDEKSLSGVGTRGKRKGIAEMPLPWIAYQSEAARVEASPPQPGTVTDLSLGQQTSRGFGERQRCCARREQNLISASGSQERGANVRANASWALPGKLDGPCETAFLFLVSTSCVYAAKPY